MAQIITFATFCYPNMTSIKALIKFYIDSVLHLNFFNENDEISKNLNLAQYEGY